MRDSDKSKRTGGVDLIQVAWMLAVVGSLIGVVGGLVGTLVSIKRAGGPNQRRVVVVIAAAIWLWLASFLLLLLVLPAVWRMVLWLPYLIALAVVIAVGSRWHARAREADEAGVESGAV